MGGTWRRTTVLIATLVGAAVLLAGPALACENPKGNAGAREKSAQTEASSQERSSRSGEDNDGNWGTKATQVKADREAKDHESDQASEEAEGAEDEASEPPDTEDENTAAAPDAGANTAGAAAAPAANGSPAVPAAVEAVSISATPDVAAATPADIAAATPAAQVLGLEITRPAGGAAASSLPSSIALPRTGIGLGLAVVGFALVIGGVIVLRSRHHLAGASD